MSLSGGGRARTLQRTAAPDRRATATQLAAGPYFHRASVSSFGSQTSSADLKETGFLRRRGQVLGLRKADSRDRQAR